MTAFQDPLWLVAAFVSLAVLLLVVALGFGAASFTEWRRSRRVLDRVSGDWSSPVRRAAGKIFRDVETDGGGRLDALLEALPRSGDLARLLDQSNIGWSPLRFWLLTVALAAVAGLFGLVVVHVGIVAIPMAIFGATLPYVNVRWKKRKRVDAFEKLFPDAIDLLGRAIRAGHAFSTGLQMVADEMDDPLGPEFERVFEEQKFGLAIEESLTGMADRIDLMDLRIFVTAVLIQREVGGNLAEVLDNIAHTIRERFTIQRQVRVYTAQGRLTGYLLSSLPLAMALLIYTMNSEYMSILWIEPAGRIMISLAAMMQIFGYFVIRKIVNIEV